MKSVQSHNNQPALLVLSPEEEEDAIARVQRFRPVHLDEDETALLPPGGVLFLDIEKEAILLLIDGAPAELQMFSPVEFALIRTILESHPRYASYAQLLSAAYGWPLKMSRQHVDRVLEEGSFNVDRDLRQLRNMLSRSRPRFRRFGLEMSAIVETGYALKKYKKPARGTEPRLSKHAPRRNKKTNVKGEMR